MPYPTFFNLPDAKRQRLMDAAWQEFTAVAFTEASINRIIQAASISRGSFYQYFSGKQDLFSHLLSTALETGKQMFSAELTVHNNDLFSSVLGMYDMILWQKNKGRIRTEQHRVYTLLKLNRDMDMTFIADYLDQDFIALSIRNLLCQSGYEITKLEVCKALLSMLASISMSCLADSMRHPQREDHNRIMLEHQLLIIRRGLAPYRQE